MKIHQLAALALSVVLLSGCAETFLSRAELEKRGYKVENGQTHKPPTPSPSPTRTYAPWGNTDPRKGKVELDHHCGFWSCQDTHMQCVGPVLIITSPDATPVRVTDAEECKP